MIGARLEEGDVPWGALHSTAEVVDHPHLLERGRWREISLPSGDPSEVLDHPFLTELPRDDDVPHVPGLGEDTTHVLAELGYTSAEVARLLERGVVAGPVT